jgi:uncharacterized membrane protein required for colicin V production
MIFFDLVFTISLTLSLFSGYKKQNSAELLSVLFFIAGYALAIRFGSRIARQLSQYINNYDHALSLSYILILICCLLLSYASSKVIFKFISFRKKNLLSKITSSISGLIRGLIINFYIFFLVSNSIPSFNDDLELSFFYPWFKAAIRFLEGIILA